MFKVCYNAATELSIQGRGLGACYWGACGVTGGAACCGDFRTTNNGRAGGLLARTGSLSGHPSKQQPRSTYA
ncbi:hypothetical protein J6590_098032 [Homalodisca vitripennis]|nr:hypothetical protein J6590_098032 [Homalodisca vitripennis]